jgi:CubicO group peptidase (beta-lactamase class C family)
MTTQTQTQPKVSQEELQAFVRDRAEQLQIPGVAVGIYIDGEEQYAAHGITSVENPLPVDENTLFQFGSTGKTYTATAIMRLVEEGKVDLDAPVKQYVPELKLKDKSVEDAVTILHLLNHTAGWSGDLMDRTGDGDDALELYVKNMEKLEQVTPLGQTISYNNASLSLAGRVIEKVTGKTYEAAIKELLFEPLGLEHSFFFPNEVMTRRFVVGHNQHKDDSITVARPWALPRGGTPAGGISSNSGDLITWARFHLGDGTNKKGERVLSEELLKKMQEPTAESPGGAVGDGIGIGWWLRDVDGVKQVSHGGDTLGQHSDFKMIPERRFAISTLTNCGPNGGQFNDEVVKWALENYVGVIDKDPEPTSLSEADLEQFTGEYETIAATCEIAPKDGGLEIDVKVRPEVLKQLLEDGAEIKEDEMQSKFPIGLLEGPGDKYIVTDGPAKGMKGYFVRNASGEIESIHVGGRLATRKGK